MTNDRGEKTVSSPLVRHPVMAFFAIAFAISWGGILAICLPTGIPGTGEALDSLLGPVGAAMLAGPFLSALIMSTVLDGRAGLARLSRGFTVWRARPIEWAAAILLIPACALAVLLPLSAVSPDYMPGFLGPQGGITLIALSLAGGFAVAVIEETGWTGLATPRLLEGSGMMPAAVGLGIIHGFWHFLSNVWMEGAEFGLVFVPYFLTAWILAVVVMRILAVWIYARTRSTLLAAVTHASHTGGLLAIWPTATSPVQDLIWTAAFGTLGLIAVLTIASFPSQDLL